MGVGPSVRIVRVGTLAILALTACRGARPSESRCRALALAAAADAVAVCQRELAGGHDPKTGGLLAYAMVNSAAPGDIDVDAIRALAQQIGDTPDGAEIWHQLGEALRITEQPGTLEAYARALDHRAPTDSRGRAKDEYALFHVLLVREQFQLAAEHLATAYELATSNGEPGLRAYIGLGAMHFFLDLGDLRGAERMSRELEPLIGPDSPYYGILRMNQIQLELADGHYDLAAAGCRDVLRLATEAGDSGLEHDARIDLTAAELYRGDVAAASAALAPDPAGTTPIWRASHAFAAARIAYAQGHYADAERAAAGGITNETEDWQFRVQTERGRALIALGRPADAEMALRAAIDIIESERATIALDELKTWLLADRREPYELLFSIAADRGDAMTALEIAQAATARTFLDTLVPVPSAAQDSLGPAAAASARRVDAIRALARSLRSSPATRPIAGPALVGQLSDLVVLSYFFAGDNAWLIAIDRGRASLHRLELGRAAIIELQSRWLASLEDTTIATELGDALFPPAVRPARGRRIFIAADGGLHQLPFAALIVDGHRLIETNELAQVPGVAVLAALAAVPVATGPAVVVGDPSGDLPGARIEAETAAQALGVVPAIGAAAERDAVLAAGTARVLHLATHTSVEGDQPAFDLADGPLTAGEIVDARLGPAIVIAASCASGTSPGREAWGALATSFLASGSTVVASRWSIDDSQTRSDMEALYRAGISDPIHAVAVVQRAAISAHRPVSSWAAYVVLGRGASPN